MKSVHPEIVAASNIMVLTWQSEQLNDMPCVICGLQLTVDRLARHLGHHMQEAAIFVLPHQGNEEEGQEESASERSWGSESLVSSGGVSILGGDPNLGGALED